MEFLCSSIGSLLFKVSVYAFPHGYYHYVHQTLPDGRDYAKIDSRIIEKYEVKLSKSRRSRVRKKGGTVCKYWRMGSEAFILATEGSPEHRFFHEEACYKDIRKQPLVIGYYTVGMLNEGRTYVKLRKSRLRHVQAQLDRMTYEDGNRVQAYFDGISSFTFKGVLEQKQRLKARVNIRRRRAGLTLLV